jgi:hypothetical protein
MSPHGKAAVIRAIQKGSPSVSGGEDSVCASVCASMCVYEAVWACALNLLLSPYPAHLS